MNKMLDLNLLGILLFLLLFCYFDLLEHSLNME